MTFNTSKRPPLTYGKEKMCKKSFSSVTHRVNCWLELKHCTSSTSALLRLDVHASELPTLVLTFLPLDWIFSITIYLKAGSVEHCLFWNAMYRFASLGFETNKEPVRPHIFLCGHSCIMYSCVDSQRCHWTRCQGGHRSSSPSPSVGSWYPSTHHNFHAL